MIDVLVFVGVVVGVAVALLAVSLGVALIVCGGIRVGDQAARPTYPVQATNPGVVAVANTDAALDAIAAGHAAVLQDDPHLTRLISAWRDDIHNNLEWTPATWDAGAVLDARADEARDT